MVPIESFTSNCRRLPSYWIIEVRFFYFKKKYFTTPPPYGQNESLLLDVTCECWSPVSTYFWHIMYYCILILFVHKLLWVLLSAMMFIMWNSLVFTIMNFLYFIAIQFIKYFTDMIYTMDNLKICIIFFLTFFVLFVLFSEIEFSVFLYIWKSVNC